MPSPRSLFPDVFIAIFLAFASSLPAAAQDYGPPVLPMQIEVQTSSAAPKPVPVKPAPTVKPKPKPVVAPAPVATKPAEGSDPKGLPGDSSGSGGFFSPANFQRENFGYTAPLVSTTAVASPWNMSRDPAVIGSNLLLAILLFLIVGTSYYVFNNLIESHGADIHRFLRRFHLVSALHRKHDKSYSKRLPLIALALLLYAVLAAYMNPSFSLFDTANIGMVLVTLATMIVGAYAKDFSRLITATAWKWPSWFEANFVGLLLAAATVIAGRMLHIVPGYIFGVPIGLFIGAAAFSEREGPFEFLGILWMLVFTMVVWTVGPFVAHLPVLSDFLLLLYVIFAEWVFFEMLPIGYLAGASIIRWSKVAWGTLFVFSTFLLFHTIFNKNSTILAISQTTLGRGTLIVLSIYVVFTFSVWAYTQSKKKAVVSHTSA